MPQWQGSALPFLFFIFLFPLSDGCRAACCSESRIPILFRTYIGMYTCIYSAYTLEEREPELEHVKQPKYIRIHVCESVGFLDQFNPGWITFFFLPYFIITIIIVLSFILFYSYFFLFFTNMHLPVTYAQSISDMLD